MYVYIHQSFCGIGNLYKALRQCLRLCIKMLAAIILTFVSKISIRIQLHCIVPYTMKRINVAPKYFIRYVARPKEIEELSIMPACFLNDNYTTDMISYSYSDEEMLLHDFNITYAVKTA